MSSDELIRAHWKAEGLRTKRNNLIAAFLSGAVLVFISLYFFPHTNAGIVVGFLIGFFYANGFEYCLHRFLLHSGSGIFCQQHMAHHTTLHSPDAARYVNFSRNPWGVVALFFANAIPFLVAQWLFHSVWTAGVFASFALYYMAFEEIHWRSHMRGRLPRCVRPAARHHLMHHAQDSGRFNVFLPIFDWLAGLFQPRARMSAPEAGR
jgi:hypothetical protein